VALHPPDELAMAVWRKNFLQDLDGTSLGENKFFKKERVEGKEARKPSERARHSS
jgi:hypothetical protein